MQWGKKNGRYSCIFFKIVLFMFYNLLTMIKDSNKS